MPPKSLARSINASVISMPVTSRAEAGQQAAEAPLAAADIDHLSCRTRLPKHRSTHASSIPVRIAWSVVIQS